MSDRPIRDRLAALIPHGDLAERTLKSGIWVSALNVGDRLLQLVLLVVMARLLDPADFGLMGIALLTVNALRRFSRLGINESLIYHADDDVDRYLNTAWSMRLGRGFLLASIAFVAAPFIAQLFGEPRATDVVRFIGLSPLLAGFQNPGIVYFKKNLEFHKQFAYQMSGSVVNFAEHVIITGGYLAIAVFVSRTVWALVVGYVLADFTRTLASYLIHQVRPWPEFSLDFAREMFSYGKWITASGVVQFILNEGDDALVGILLTTASLGFYTTAFRIAKAPATEITQIVSGVMFPTYSQLQDDVERLRGAFFRTLKFVTLLSIPVGIGIVLVAPSFVRAFMGVEWLPMVTTMQLIALYGTLVSIAASFGAVWKAVGRPDYPPKLGALRIVILTPLIIPATLQFGIEGTAGAVLAVYALVLFPIDVYLVAQSVDTSVWHIGRILSYPVAATAMMAGAVLVATRTLPGIPALTEFGILVVVGIASYLFAVAILELQFEWNLMHNVREISNAFRG
jgi:PST family polysaccharide transporter/lipopolysaccharide exporter